MRLTLLILMAFFSPHTFGQSGNVTLLNHWDGDWVSANNGGYQYNEVWGFVQDNEEYAVIGSVNGTHIFHVTKNNELIEVDFVSGAYQGSNVVHRDYHDYNGYLYGICQQGTSTLQIMDLSYLPDSVHLVYNEDSLVSICHNVFIDSSSALMYICNPPDVSMKVFSLADPLNPQLLYQHQGFEYIHDVYARNDTAYLASAREGLWVYDFSNPSTPINLGSLEFYVDKGFNHSGWLNETGTIYLMNDETPGMRIKVCDVSDLTDINVVSLFSSEEWKNTAPHNVMFKDGIAYVSYYNDGLQIFDVRDPKAPKRIGYYDTYSGPNDANWKGAWGIYAYLPSGKLLVSDRTSGLFVFDFIVPALVNQNHGIFPNPAMGETSFYLRQQKNGNYQLAIYASDGKLVDLLEGYFDRLTIDVSNYAPGSYTYKYQLENGDETGTGKFIVQH